MSDQTFDGLISRLATAWAGQDPDGAASCFHPEAVYMEPPDAQLFVGTDQLRAYFSPLEPGTFLEIHGSWFDSVSGTGAVEFSFGVAGAESADHGVAVVALRDGLISTWREYHVKGPRSFAEFTATSGKDWQWHIGNYP